MTASKLPLKVEVFSDKPDIVDADGKSIISVNFMHWNFSDKELPDLIVTAVNSHKELLEAVQAAEDYFAIMQDIVENTCETHRGKMITTRTLKGKTLDEHYKIYKSKAQIALKNVKGN